MSIQLCALCGYRITGLALDRRGLVQCPECGEAQAPRKAPTCNFCGYELAGLRADREGRTICPECGVRQLLSARPALA